MAIAMGNYYFTCATTGDRTQVEYTFGYKRCDDGKTRIFLHHSSVPYSAPAAAAPTVAEVEECQAKWAAAIADISKAYLEKVSRYPEVSTSEWTRTIRYKSRALDQSMRD